MHSYNILSGKMSCQISPDFSMEAMIGAKRKTCEQCGKEFLNWDKKENFCSKKCEDEAVKERMETETFL